MGKHVNVKDVPEPHHKDYPKDGNPKSKKKGGDDKDNDNGLDIVEKITTATPVAAGGLGPMSFDTSKVTDFIHSNKDLFINIFVGTEKV